MARTVRTLELLAFRPVSASELAAYLRVHPRTARRLLRRLHDEGYVTRGEGARRYKLSPRLVAVAAQAVASSDLLGCAAPLLESLHVRTGLSGQLWAPSYTGVVCLARSPPIGLVALGELVPAPTCAAGKALLAARPHWRDSVLGALALAPDPVGPELDAEAASIAKHGFAVTDSEPPHGGWGLAAVVHVNQDPIAAVTANGVGARGTAAVAGEVLQVVERLEHAMRASTSDSAVT